MGILDRIMETRAEHWKQAGSQPTGLGVDETVCLQIFHECAESLKPVPKKWEEVEGSVLYGMKIRIDTDVPEGCFYLESVVQD